MLTVDLLPGTYRRSAESSLEQLHRMPLVWLIAGLLMIIAAIPGVLVYVRTRTLDQLNAKIQALQPKHQSIEQIRIYLQQLHEQEQTFKGLVERGGEWSRRLNVLSTVIPDGVWFTELALERGKNLIIQGSALSEGGAEMMRVGRLVQDLKASEEFGRVVKDIQIESIKRVQDKDLEIVKFTLTCALTDAPELAKTGP